MTRLSYHQESILDASPARVWEWHERPYAFARIMPAWESTRSDRRNHTFENATELTFYFRLGPKQITWRAVYEDVIPGLQFCDRQIQGPFAYWKHTHRFEAAGKDRTRMIDHVDYELPLGSLGRYVAASYSHARLARLFGHRHDFLKREFSRRVETPLRIAITGATGLVAQRLIPLLTTRGHEVYEMSRRPSRYPWQIHWDPARKTIDLEALSRVDAVIHLAGESIVGWWSADKRRRILDSRVMGTRFLVDSLKQLATRPRHFICASAVGYYGADAHGELREDAPAGQSFLAQVCQAWEAEAQRAQDLKMRTAMLRIGMVLTPQGGALKSLLPAFRLGLGGRLGSGSQHMPWIHIDDLCEAAAHVLHTPSLVGPVNAVAPSPLSNKEFTRTLANVLHRPAIFPVPRVVLRSVLRDMADDLLLADLNVAPNQLQRSGFEFLYPELETALKSLIPH